MLDFTYLTTVFPLDCLYLHCVLGPGIPLTEQHAHSQGYAAFLEMHTLRDRHTRAPNREYAMRILRDRSIGAKGNR